MSRPEPDSAAPAKRRHILVVDAERTTREALSEALDEAGFVPETADSRRAALDTLGRGRFHLVVVDVATPGLDGPGLVEELRLLHPEVPVVVMTATHEADAALEAEMLGASSFVNKPLDLALVLAHFAAVLRV